MLKFIQNLINKANSKGIPIPLFRDHGIGSVSFTLVVSSFANAMYAIDSAKSPESMMYALGLFSICGSMYFGKRWQMRKIGSIDLSAGEDSNVKDGK